MALVNNYPVRFTNYEILTYDDEGNNLRIIGNEHVGRNFRTPDQLWCSLELRNNSILIVRDSRTYDVYFDITYGVLMIADLQNRKKTPLCFQKGCGMIGESSNQDLLCGKCLIEKQTNVVTPCKGQIKIEASSKEFRTIVNENYLATLARGNPSLTLHYGIEMTIKAAVGYLVNVKDEFKLYPDEFTVWVEEKLRALLIRSTFTFGNIKLRYNTTDDVYEYCNMTEEPPTWKPLCAKHMCFKPVVENLDVCRKCGGGWKQIIYKTLTRACGVNHITSLREKDLDGLQECIARLPKKHIEVDGMRIFFRENGQLYVKRQSAFQAICMNWDRGCLNIYNGDCNKCSIAQSNAANLVYLAPYDMYFIHTTTKDYPEATLNVLKKSYTVSNLTAEEITLVDTMISINKRGSVESFAAAYVAVLTMKKLYNGGNVQMVNSLAKIGRFPWRAINYILNQHGMKIEITDNVVLPEDYNPAILLSQEELRKNEKKPFVYYADDGKGAYVGYSNNVRENTRITTATYHYNRRSKNEIPFRNMNIKHDEVDEKSKRVATLGNTNNHSQTALETTMMLAYCAAFEFFGIGKPLVNVTLSTTDLPEQFIYDISRIVKHITKDKTIKLTCNDHNAWKGVLEPTTRQKRDPTRAAIVRI